MSDVPVITNQTILTHQLDIVLHDEKEKICLLIAISIPGDSKVNTIETEKLRKYKDLEIEVSGMWKVRTEIVLVIIGALGTIKKRGENLQVLPGHLSAIELQKIA